MTEVRPRPAALVTGGAVRLGREIALALARSGHDIALHYGRSAQAAQDTARAIRAIGVACETFSLDLTDVAAIPALLGDVQAAFPGLRVLVNSASAYTQAGIAATTPEMFDEQFGTNLRAPFFLTQAFARIVTAGHVVNIIDNKLAFNQPDYAAYLLAKKALAEFTRMAAIEYAPRVVVNGVAPGVTLPAATRSPEYVAWRIGGIPLNRQGTVADVTEAVLFLLGSAFITGQILIVDGGESLTNVGRNAAQFDPSKV